jgi:hypothetical protein
MHEVAIAQALLATAERAAREAGLEHVRALNVELGPRAGVAPAALSFALQLAADGTLVQGAEVVFSGPGAEPDPGEDVAHEVHAHDRPDDSAAALARWTVRLGWIEGT